MKSRKVQIGMLKSCTNFFLGWGEVGGGGVGESCIFKCKWAYLTPLKENQYIINIFISQKKLLLIFCVILLQKIHY